MAFRACEAVIVPRLREADNSSIQPIQLEGDSSIIVALPCITYHDSALPRIASYPSGEARLAGIAP